MFLTFSLFILGTAVGSFLNVVVLRLDKESIRGRSHCPHCGKNLEWFELVPILSFFAQRGKCRSCGVRLSWQYPVVEFLSGVAFLLVASRFLVWPPLGVTPEFVASPLVWWVWPLVFLWMMYASILLAIAVYDIRHYLIPDSFMVPLLVLGFIGAAYQHFLWRTQPLLFPSTGMTFIGPEASFLGRQSGSIGVFLGGGVAAALFIGSVWLLSRGRAMGFGDVKLALFMGFALGWPDVAVALLVAFVGGTLFAIPLLLLRKKAMKSMLPLAPFLAWGTLVTMIAGDRLVSFYFRVFPNVFL